MLRFSIHINICCLLLNVTWVPRGAFSEVSPIYLYETWWITVKPRCNVAFVYDLYRDFLLNEL